MSNSFIEHLRQSRLPTIILVGNGPSACESSYGDIVDSFSEVIRFNGYPQTPEYAAMVGTRTTTWVLNEEQTGEIRPPFGVSLVRILSEGFSNRFHAETKLPRTHDTILNPSSGVVMAQMFLRQNIQVYTVGMDGYREGRKRYWGEIEGAEVSRRQHDREAEQKFWRDNRQNIIPLREAL